MVSDSLIKPCQDPARKIYQKLEDGDAEGIEVLSIGEYKFISFGGMEDCSGSLSMEGAFNFTFDFNKAANLLNIIGEVKKDRVSGCIDIDNNISLFENGTLSIRGKNENKIRERVKDILSILIRSRDCVECGICTGRCPQNALFIDAGINVDETKCEHCGKCLRPCTVSDFEKDIILK
jgi:ferredoxin